jgi:hypothetical protein
MRLPDRPEAAPTWPLPWAYEEDNDFDDLEDEDFEDFDEDDDFDDLDEEDFEDFDEDDFEDEDFEDFDEDDEDY